MSTLCNDSVIASNNSINDNKYNADKITKSSTYKIRRILKTILRTLRHKFTKQEREIICGNQKHKSIESCDDYWSSIEDNSVNEELESKILNDALYVHTNDDFEIELVKRDPRFVPVHFARTEAGTFFWTTMQKPADCDLIQPMYCCSSFQQPQPQFCDRWVQA